MPPTAAKSDRNGNISFLESRLAYTLFALSFVVFCGPCSIVYVFIKKPVTYDDRLALKQVTPLKPVKRKRALTLPLPLENTFMQKLKGAKKETRSQMESSLFRLPAEVRIMVYKEYFGKEICLALEDERLKAYQAERAGGNLSRFADVLPLLQTCRRIYSESISLLYSTPTFSFSTAPAFLAFYAGIFSQRSNAVTSVKFDFAHNSTLPFAKVTYSNIISQCQIRALLPKLSLKSDLTLWKTCCIVLQRIAGLKELKVLVDLETFGAVDYECASDKLFLDRLQCLKEEKVDIELHVKGNVWEISGRGSVGRRWIWKLDRGEWLKQT